MRRSSQSREISAMWSHDCKNPSYNTQYIPVHSHMQPFYFRNTPHGLFPPAPNNFPTVGTSALVANEPYKFDGTLIEWVMLLPQYPQKISSQANFTVRNSHLTDLHSDTMVSDSNVLLVTHNSGIIIFSDVTAQKLHSEINVGKIKTGNARIKNENRKQVDLFYRRSNHNRFLLWTSYLTSVHPRHWQIKLLIQLYWIQ